jgi:superfamily II DNA or RNA helicase
MATGCGKTAVAGMCAMRQPKRTLFIVHLRTIVEQTASALREMTGLQVGVEMASSVSSLLDPEPIVVASVQSLNARDRLQKFHPEEFSLIIGDEIHHGLAQGWRNVFDYFPTAKVLGLTATPERGDKKKLGEIIESIAYEYALKQACDDGYLVKPRMLSIVIPGLDFSKIPRKRGDYSQEELSEIMIRYASQTAHRSIEAVYGLYPHELDAVPESQWSEYVGDRPAKTTLAFCVSRLHAEKVKNAFNSFREGVCAYVDGETPHDERRERFDNFEKGIVPILANCGVTIEGYDNPNIQNILDLAPTMSRPRELQKIGRGTRTLRGTLDGLDSVKERLAAIAQSQKPHIRIVDFTDNTRDHRLVTVIDIYGDAPEAHEKRAVLKDATEKAIDVEEQVVLHLKERYALAKTNFDETERDAFTGAKKKKKLTKAQKAERAAQLLARGLSGKEFELLANQKLHPERRSLEENRILLKTMQHRRLAHLCSYRQGFLLQKHGYTNNEIKGMSFSAASMAIDAIAKNGWRPLPRKPEQSFTDRMNNETAEEYGDGTSF